MFKALGSEQEISEWPVGTHVLAISKVHDFRNEFEWLQRKNGMLLLYPAFAPPIGDLFYLVGVDDRLCWRKIAGPWEYVGHLDQFERGPPAGTMFIGKAVFLSTPSRKQRRLPISAVNRTLLIETGCKYDGILD